MKTLLLFTLILVPTLSSAQTVGNERLELDDIMLELKGKCKDMKGKLRFENLSAMIGETPHSICYRYVCNVKDKKAKTDGNIIAINDVQVICLDSSNVSPSVVDDLRNWNDKHQMAVDNTAVKSANPEAIKK